MIVTMILLTSFVESKSKFKFILANLSLKEFENEKENDERYVNVEK